MKLRLHQFLSQTGLFKSKFDIEDAISKGLISIDGKICTKRNFQFNPNTKKVSYLGNALSVNNKKIYLGLNKPIGYISTKLTKKDIELGKKSIFSLLGRFDQETLNTLQPAGRLDEDTSGLLILSNDGHFNYSLANPDSKLLKKYHVQLKGRITGQDCIKILSGVKIKEDETGKKIDSYVAKPVSLDRIGDFEVFISIHEGKKREIRRIFLSLGNEVVKLERISIGNLALGDLRIKQGEFRVFSGKNDLKNRIH